VCVPFGTRNHFARDLGLDREDPLGALAAFSGVERRIDVGWAGERLFLNNVSLGLYAGLVHRRERHRGRRQALASVRALSLAALHRHRLHVSIDGREVAARVILIANNAYMLDLFSIGERRDIESGLLHVYVARGLLPGSWEDRSCSSFTLDAPERTLRAASDGEPVILDLPLGFRIEPAALRVLLPPTPG
jgi:diacylglycerol kinase family enzyme